MQVREHTNFSPTYFLDGLEGVVDDFFHPILFPFNGVCIGSGIRVDRFSNMLEKRGDVSTRCFSRDLKDTD